MYFIDYICLKSAMLDIYFNKPRRPISNTDVHFKRLFDLPKFSSTSIVIQKHDYRYINIIFSPINEK